MNFILGMIVGLIVGVIAVLLFAAYKVNALEASGEIPPAFPGEDANGDCAKCHGEEPECAYCVANGDTV